ncbi:MAG: hypothetical protein HKM26_02210 [Winogradskyella sp.]|nr:hypothetical protein [Winogradskyella sp.]
MSDNLSNKPNNEEVELGQLFNAIGKVFENLFKLIGKLFKLIFEFIISALKPIVQNIKLIVVSVTAAAVIGFAIDKFSPTIYSSDMLVQPYFQSKYKLANNVDYFNALIAAQNYSELSRIFDIDSTSAEKLVEFDMKIGPETPNDLLSEYNEYLKEIDTTLADEVTYEEYIENRDILSGEIFSINAKSKENDIFLSLENGFRKTFENEYSKKLKRIRDSTILIRKAALKVELRRLDSLQNIYFGILKAESESNKLSLGMEGMFPLQQERIPTREYELFQEELKVRDAIIELDRELIEESVYYDVLSGFEEVGNEAKDFENRYFIILPALVFAVMALIFIFYRMFNYIKEY